MSRHLVQDLDDCYHRLLGLSGKVEEMIAMSVQALVFRQRGLAGLVIGKDSEIDQLEVRIEEECLKMLAMHQPVAADLRRIATMMKVNNDLERMADLAVNIAERALSLQSLPEFPIPKQISDMVEMTTSMVRHSLDAFVNLDVDLAYLVINQDDAMDAMNVRVIAELTELMARDPQWISSALHCFSAARHLERIADHATNIASDLIYMVSGDIIRHRKNDGPLQAQTQG
ncbi:MAG: phosphate signaling complex protein PhoU [Pirellulales bacterium]